MKKELAIILVIVILGISTGLFLYLWVKAEKELNIRKAVIRQNELAFNSKLEVIKNENGVLYKKLAFVENINQKLKRDSTALALLTRNQKQKILSLVIAMARLEKFRDSVIAVQDFEIPKNLVGRQLFFNSDNTKEKTFYQYKEIVTLGNPSKNDLTINSVPFSIAVATMRDAKGIMSGAIEFNPKWINNYLRAENVYVSLDVDEYSQAINSDNSFSFSILPSVGIVSMPELYFSYGAGVLINKKHLIEYKTILGKQFHLVNYSYNIPIW